MASSVREQILQALAAGEFVSGEMLGAQLGISRAAISKHVKALSKLGLDIFSITGKGYRLASPIELLSAEAILNQLDPQYPKPPVEVHTTIDSTNSALLSRVNQSLQPAHCCLAEFQSKGRGRRGKVWQSPFASHIYLSLYWPLNQGMAEAMGLSLVAGLALVDCLKQLGIEDVKVKWPNDVYVQGKKIAGILVELDGQSYENGHAVIGVGLNVSMPEFTGHQIDQPWTDIKCHLGATPSRNAIAANLITHMINRLGEHKVNGLQTVYQLWNKLDYYYDQPISLLVGEKSVNGVCKGINEQGAILLEQGEQVVAYFGGEISVRQGN